MLRSRKPASWLLSGSILIAFSHCSWAATPRSGAAFLKIGTGARAAAMGEAYTAVADDVSAMYYNPGGLATLSRSELGATHTEWLLGTKFDFIGFARPTRMGTFGVGALRLSSGEIEGRDAERNSVGGFTASDSAYTVSFSRMAGLIGAGANVKFLQSRIAGYSASTIALDFGARRQFEGSPLSLGFSVLNIGQGMKYLDQRDPLPLTVSIGSAYRLAGVLQLALDVRRNVPDAKTTVGFGTEYALLSSFSVRMGYASAMAQSRTGGTLGGMNGLGGGFGMKLGKYRADYTFTPFGDLGNAQRISLGARF